MIFGVVISKPEFSHFSSSEPGEAQSLFADNPHSASDSVESSPSLTLSEEKLANVACLLLKRMAGKFGGDCTLNELRVMNAVSVHSFASGSCSPTVLARDTGIPKSTVSRSLASLVSKGWLVESRDTQDRRRRIIELSEKSRLHRSNDLQAVSDWNSRSGR